MCKITKCGFLMFQCTLRVPSLSFSLDNSRPVTFTSPISFTRAWSASAGNSCIYKKTSIGTKRDLKVCHHVKYGGSTLPSVADFFEHCEVSTLC